MRSLHAAVALAVVALSVLATDLGLAADLRVLLIGPGPGHATVARMQRELELLGIEVELATPDVGADLAALARESGAAAVARVEDAPPEILLWVEPPHGAGAPAVTRVSEAFSGRADPGLLALRAVELLRGRLIPVAAPPEATSAPTAGATSTAGPAASSAPPPPGDAPGSSLPPSRARLHVGPAVVVSPGGVPPTPALRVGGGFRPVPRVEIEGLAVIPLAPGTVSAPEGDIDLRALTFGVGANVTLTRPASAFGVHVGGGVGLTGLFFEGRARAPWASASGSHWSAVPFVGAGAGYRFTPVLAVRADALAAFLVPDAVLVVAGRDVASFGIPLFAGSLALEVHP